MKKLIISILLMAAFNTSAQHTINIGDRFPNVKIGPIINAPVKSFSISEDLGNKFYILNMWGTYCSPCLPEMDVLAKLQRANQKSLQVIAISGDSPERLKKYLAKKPSGIWLASDPSPFLYQAFGFSYVGQSVIINNKHEVIAMVKTDAINQQMINNILKGIKIASNAAFKEQPVTVGKDIFGVDSTMTEDYTVRGYMKGQEGMEQHYLNAPYFGRRVTYVNACIAYCYMEAYQITSPKQVMYEMDEKEACNFNDVNSLYCINLLVKSGQKDSLYHILRKKLQGTLPVKARLTEKMMPVYVLKMKSGTSIKLPVSTSEKSSYSMSGNGFVGKGVSMGEFTDYLNNELDLPVADETGLSKRYDIQTIVDMRDKENVIQSVTELGFVLEKSDRMMKVMVLYK